MNSNPQNVICLYSKFSNSSKKFVESSSSLPINFVCIDNKEVRNMVISDPKMQITFVPCILSVFSDGRLEKFEGVDAFKWLENIKSHATPQSSEPSEPSAPSAPSTPSAPSAPSAPSEPSARSEPSAPSAQSEPSEPSTEKNNEFSKHDFQSKQIRDKRSQIADLDFDQETEGDLTQVSSGMKSSLSDKENLMIKSMNKISTKNSGKKDVMTAAREMEKMREQEESQKKRPPNMPKI